MAKKTAKKMQEPYELDFSDLANSEEFTKFMRIFKDLTGIPTGIRHPYNKNVKKLYFNISEMNPVCKLIRSAREGFEACQNCNQHFFDYASQMKKGLQYHCHAGLVDFTIPIYVEDHIIAYLSGGQILPKKPNEKGFVELRSLVKDIPLDAKALRKAYFSSPYMRTKKIDSALQLVTFITEYFCEQNRLSRNIRKNIKVVEINIAKEYVMANYSKPITVLEVANHVCFSENYFSRLFRSVTGESFTHYVRKIRLTEAKKLLVRTDLSITQIAHQVGFGSLQYFNNTFKILEELSPSEYRKRNKSDRNFIHFIEKQ